LVDEQGNCEETQAAGIRKGREEKFAKERVCDGSRNVAFYLCAGIFDELVVLDTRGTGCHAGHATKAIIHMQSKALIEWSFTLSGLFHHVDPSTGRVHLFAP